MKQNLVQASGSTAFLQPGSENRRFWPVLIADPDEPSELDIEHQVGCDVAAGNDMAVVLTFRPASETPGKSKPLEVKPALIFNQCDGYHHAFARFDEAGVFHGFYEWTGTAPFEPGRFFCAWALLPDESALLPTFGSGT